MSNTVLIIGQSGSGKSTSIRNLDPSSTFILNVLDKPLPFKGYKKNYTPVTKENKNGNYFINDSWDVVCRCIREINDKRPDIKTLVIDDWQYILANEFMRRVSEKGFEKFSELGNHGWSIINACLSCRSDLTIFVIAHSDIDQQGRSKCKTIGKMLDEKIAVEGMFTTVLHSRIIDGQYLFQTQADDDYLCKSPMGMFENKFVPNDLVSIKAALENYYNEEEEQQE